MEEEEEKIKTIIRNELLKYKLISDFVHNVNGVDTQFKEFKEKTEKRLDKVEDIIKVDKYEYVTETKLVKKNDDDVGYETVDFHGNKIIVKSL